MFITIIALFPISRLDIYDYDKIHSTNGLLFELIPVLFFFQNLVDV